MYVFQYGCSYWSSRTPVQELRQFISVQVLRTRLYANYRDNAIQQLSLAVPKDELAGIFPSVIPPPGLDISATMQNLPIPTALAQKVLNRSCPSVRASVSTLFLLHRLTFDFHFPVSHDRRATGIERRSHELKLSWRLGLGLCAVVKLPSNRCWIPTGARP